MKTSGWQSVVGKLSPALEAILTNAPEDHIIIAPLKLYLSKGTDSQEVMLKIKRPATYEGIPRKESDHIWIDYTRNSARLRRGKAEYIIVTGATCGQVKEWVQDSQIDSIAPHIAPLEESECHAIRIQGNER